MVIAPVLYQVVQTGRALKTIPLFSNFYTINMMLVMSCRPNAYFVQTRAVTSSGLMTGNDCAAASAIVWRYCMALAWLVFSTPSNQ